MKQKKFPVVWFFVIGIALGLIVIPVFLYLKTQSILGEISVAGQALSQSLAHPGTSVGQVQLNRLPVPAGVSEPVPPGTSVDVPTPSVSEFKSDPYTKPPADHDRLNILLLGIRGVNDPYGGTLTDSIMVLSYKYSTNQLAFISVPRDLYIKIPYQNVWAKINYAYALGRELGGEHDALELAKTSVQYVTGLHINYVVRADLDIFVRAVDALGGIQVTLSKPFNENSQWKGRGGFHLPAGTQALDGQQTQYYVRSRYSTSDFERARRQQQVLIAIKNKVLQLRMLANPAKISELLNIAGDHIRTDMTVEEMKQLVPLLQKVDFSRAVHLVYDNSKNGRLYSTFINNEYVLLPKGGHFAGMRNDAINILIINNQ